MELAIVLVAVALAAWVIARNFRRQMKPPAGGGCAGGCGGCGVKDGCGWMECRDNPRHKRSKRVELTPAGREAFRRARNNEDAIIERRMPPVDLQQAAAARRLLARLRKAVQEFRDDG